MGLVDSVSLLSRPGLDFGRSVLLGVGALLLGILIYTTSVRYRRGLCRLPGPILASISSLDRLRTAASGQQFRTHIRYHHRYGPLVRVGPNHVSFSSSDLIPKVYGITSRFYKVSWIYIDTRG